MIFKKQLENNVIHKPGAEKKRFEMNKEKSKILNLKIKKM